MRRGGARSPLERLWYFTLYPGTSCLGTKNKSRYGIYNQNALKTGCGLTTESEKITIFFLQFWQNMAQ